MAPVVQVGAKIGLLTASEVIASTRQGRLLAWKCVCGTTVHRTAGEVVQAKKLGYVPHCGAHKGQTS